MLVPVTTSTRIPLRSSSSMTPTWAKPRAAPPLSARPTVGRGVGGAVWAASALGTAISPTIIRALTDQATVRIQLVRTRRRQVVSSKLTASRR